MQKIKKFGALFIIIAALLWSFDGVLRRSVYSLSPIIVVFWEHALGLIFLLPIFFPKRHELKKMTRKEWLAIGVVSLFSGALGTIFYTAALGKVHYIQFSVVVLLQQLQPIWAIATAAILLKEKIRKQFLLWATIAILGSYFVTFKDLRLNVSLDNPTFVAAIFALLAGAMWAVSTSFSKIVLQKVSFITATFLRFAFAPVFALILIFLFRQSPSLVQLSADQWSTLLVIVISTGMVALLIYYYGLAKVPAKNSAIYELVWPVSAIGIDYLYYHNGLSSTQLIGAAAVLGAIYKIAKLKENKNTLYTGIVSHGTQDGRKIGFPTMNLPPDLLPAHYKKGVYAALVYYENTTYPAALYFGPRLVKGETQDILEIHMIHAHKNMYGKIIQFECKTFIRKAENFKTMNALKIQIQRDVRDVTKALS